MRPLIYALCFFVPALLQAQTNEQKIPEAVSCCKQNDFTGSDTALSAAFQIDTSNWNAIITSNAAAMERGELKPGFALYHIKSDSVTVPYLVYTPPSVIALKKRKLIVFLHGGVMNTIEFAHTNPDLPGFEPVFRAADSLQAIVLYPFAKKDYGWVKQQAAFQNILNITEKIIPLYHIDRKQMVMAGMSNGGTALFWFATQAQIHFKGYIAISASPVLPSGRIEFGKLTARKNFYSVNAKDDEVYLYTEIFKTHKANRTEAPGWHFESVESGNHAFLYNAGGDIILLHYLRKTFQ